MSVSNNVWLGKLTNASFPLGFWRAIFIGLENFLLLSRQKNLWLRSFGREPLNPWHLATHFSHEILIVVRPGGTFYTICICFNSHHLLEQKILTLTSFECQKILSVSQFFWNTKYKPVHCMLALSEAFLRKKKIESKKLAGVYKQFTRLCTMWLMYMPRFDVKVRTWQNYNSRLFGEHG